MAQSLDQTNANVRQFKQEAALSKSRLNTLNSELETLIDQEREAEQVGDSTGIENARVATLAKDEEIKKELSGITAREAAVTFELMAQDVANASKERLEGLARNFERKYGETTKKLEQFSNPIDADALAVLNKSDEMVEAAIQARRVQLNIR